MFGNRAFWERTENMDWLGARCSWVECSEPRANSRLRNAFTKSLKTRMMHQRRQRRLLYCVVHSANADCERYPTYPQDHEVPRRDEFLRLISQYVIITPTHPT
eukprot:829116-Pyramimonas_sp.AAC.1